MGVDVELSGCFSKDGISLSQTLSFEDVGERAGLGQLSKVCIQCKAAKGVTTAHHKLFCNTHDKLANAVVETINELGKKCPACRGTQKINHPDLKKALKKFNDFIDAVKNVGIPVSGLGHINSVPCLLCKPLYTHTAATDKMKALGGRCPLCRGIGTPRTISLWSRSLGSKASSNSAHRKVHKALGRIDAWLDKIDGKSKWERAKYFVATGSASEMAYRVVKALRAGFSCPICAIGSGGIPCPLPHELHERLKKQYDVLTSDDGCLYCPPPVPCPVCVTKDLASEYVVWPQVKLELSITVSGNPGVFLVTDITLEVGYTLFIRLPKLYDYEGFFNSLPGVKAEPNGCDGVVTKTGGFKLTDDSITIKVEVLEEFGFSNTEIEIKLDGGLKDCLIKKVTD